jgi:hypothetical protein
MAEKYSGPIKVSVSILLIQHFRHSLMNLRFDLLLVIPICETKKTDPPRPRPQSCHCSTRVKIEMTDPGNQAEPSTSKQCAAQRPANIETHLRINSADIRAQLTSFQSQLGTERARGQPDQVNDGIRQILFGLSTLFNSIASSSEGSNVDSSSRGIELTPRIQESGN